MRIEVYDNNLDIALRKLKKAMNREGVYREMKLRRFYEKPTEKRQRKKREAIKRTRKAENRRRYN